MARTNSSMNMRLGTMLPTFALRCLQGNMLCPAIFSGQPLLVMFWCNHCPFVQHVRATVLTMAATFQRQGGAVLAINSNDPHIVPADDTSAMRAEVRAHGYSFAYAADETGEVAARFEARCTPDFFLFDAGHRLAYRGAFDDSSPGNGRPVTGRYLANAISALWRGDGPLRVQHPSLGCSIKWRTPPRAPVRPQPAG